MPYIHNFKEQILLTANCFNKINFQTISSITIDFYIVSFLKEGVCPLKWQTKFALYIATTASEWVCA